MKLFRPIIILIAVFACALRVAIAQAEIPILQQRVDDYTNSLTLAEWQALNNRLQQFEDSTSNQVVILLLNSLHGNSIEDYAVKVFEANKLGQRNKNNGVLIVVAKEDRLVRIEVGYGLEGVLTDAVTSQIIEREMKGNFRKGNFYGGLMSGVSAIISATAGEYKVEPRGKKAPFVSGILMLLGFIFFFGFFLPMLSSKRRYVIGGGNWIYHSGWGSFGGGGGSSFGGWGGGSSGGGWGGGGGGMSGGGGATGSW
ncbi:MAG: TPM domain-containing protein [Ignavibacteriales bacterium]|nr:TPM domain-containing protein [Ignavibacteriales bacterium]